MLTTKKPIQRSAFRRKLGPYVHLPKRLWSWYMPKHTYADTLLETELPHAIFTHSTPLRRKLVNVEPWIHENKIKNLNIAIKKLNQITIYPGQTLSFWREVGKPTKRKGYQEGMILRNGVMETGTGGGLCQLTNLLFWMTLHTPLLVVERWRHSYDVFPDVRRTQPFGSGATCSYPNIDLQIKNTTDAIFQLSLKVTSEALQGTWLSNKKHDTHYALAEQNHTITHSAWGAYIRSNEIHRTSSQGEEITKVELVVKNEAIMMYEPLLTTRS